MRYQLRMKPSGPEESERPLTLNVVDNDGKVVAEGHLFADYLGGDPETLIVCGVGFEGVHKASA